MKISVIIPVYNVEAYLRQCIDSVIAQTYKDIEIILVDDGSTDKSSLICDEYAEHDDHVIVIHKENGGLSSARNAGMDAASGEYMLFLDSDDYWNDILAISRIVDRIKITQVDVLNFSYCKFFESDGSIVKKFDDIEDMPIDLADCNKQLDYVIQNGLYIASACNKLIRRSLISNIKFEVGKTSEDIVWCAELLSKAKSVDFVCENFYYYRQRKNSISHNVCDKNCLDLKDNIIKCISIADNSELWRKEYLYAYAAYQYATFFMVQAMSVNLPDEYIADLDKYKYILKYGTKNKKILVLNIGCKFIGFSNMCLFIRYMRKLGCFNK